MNKAKVIEAFKRYDQFEKSGDLKNWKTENHAGDSKSYYVEYENKKYPLKIIYCLAFNISSEKFNTLHSAKELKNLNFKIISNEDIEEIKEANRKLIKNTIK